VTHGRGARATLERDRLSLIPSPTTIEPVVHTSDSVEQTEAIAAELSSSLRGGECIALNGNLGAGKTQFVRGLVRGLGGPSRSVSSPTFVLLNMYPGGRLTVFHLDAYRVAGADDFDAIGFPELLEQGGVVVVEWAERVRELLPDGCIQVDIEPTAPTTRTITIHRAPPGE
jgi:tRNA threonylcarbamoyladenosine biosynthesis protein TsaE